MADPPRSSFSSVDQVRKPAHPSRASISRWRTTRPRRRPKRDRRLGGVHMQRLRVVVPELPRRPAIFRQRFSPLAHAPSDRGRRGLAPAPRTATTAELRWLLDLAEDEVATVLAAEACVRAIVVAAQIEKSSRSGDATVGALRRVRRPRCELITAHQRPKPAGFAARCRPASSSPPRSCASCWRASPSKRRRDVQTLERAVGRRSYAACLRRRARFEMRAAVATHLAAILSSRGGTTSGTLD